MQLSTPLLLIPRWVPNQQWLVMWWLLLFPPCFVALIRYIRSCTCDVLPVRDGIVPFGPKARPCLPICLQ